jgi:hypothetical protein
MSAERQTQRTFGVRRLSADVLPRSGREAVCHSLPRQLWPLVATSRRLGHLATSLPSSLAVATRGKLGPRGRRSWAVEMRSVRGHHLPNRGLAKKRGQAHFFPDHSFFGRPRGRSVDARPSVTAARFTQSSLP